MDCNHRYGDYGITAGRVESYCPNISTACSPDCQGSVSYPPKGPHPNTVMPIKSSPQKEILEFSDE